MQIYQCDYPGCANRVKSFALGMPNSMQTITVTVGGKRRHFHLCDDHSKAIGLDPSDGVYDVNETLLESLAEFVRDIVKED